MLIHQLFANHSERSVTPYYSLNMSIFFFYRLKINSFEVANVAQSQLAQSSVSTHKSAQEMYACAGTTSTESAIFDCQTSGS